jgi:hypothetical protein
MVCALSLPALAQAPAAKATPEHIALARAVLDFTGASKSFDNVVPKLLTDARNMVLRTRPTLQADLDAAALEVAGKMATADDELVGKIANVYAQKFSEQELREIAAFYQSPTGKKMTAELPSVLSESYKLMQEWSREMSVEIMTNLRVEL